MIMDSEKNLHSQLIQATNGTWDKQTVSALTETLNLIIPLSLEQAPSLSTSNASTSLIFDPNDLFISAPNTTPPSAESRHILRELTLAAPPAANSLGCGSLLLGQSSESDEYGDVAFWLGDGPGGKDYYGPGNVESIVSSLQLSSDEEPQPISLKPPTYLPETLKFPAINEKLQRVVDLLSEFEDRYAFAVRKPQRDGGGASDTVLAIYIGKLRGEGWAGLIGAGLWME